MIIIFFTIGVLLSLRQYCATRHSTWP